MVNKKKIFLLPLLVVSFCFVSTYSALAYEPIPAHRDLTKKIIETYNKYYQPKITPEQAQWIIDGSIKEDTAPRWINHFYDSVNNQGWTGEKEGDIPADTILRLSKIFLSPKDAVSSLNWLHNQDIQTKYSFYEGNQTYERALSAFAYASLPSEMVIERPDFATFENSYKALGHTLHLLEDLGVPAHTRNDTHADVMGSGDQGEPYEKWVADNANFNHLDNLDLQKESFSCVKIDDCFVQLAKYSNENFNSADTIEDLEYKLPIITKKEPKDEFDVYYNGDIPLFIKSRKTNLSTVNDPLVHQAYWQLLSKQIILAGVQVIKNFNQDARDESENVKYPQHIVMFKKISFPMFSPYGTLVKLWSFTRSSFSQVVSSVGNLFSNILSDNNQGFRPAGQIGLDQPSEAVQLTERAATDKTQNAEPTSKQPAGYSAQTPGQSQPQNQSQNQAAKPSPSQDIEVGLSEEDDLISEKSNPEEGESQKQSEQEQKPEQENEREISESIPELSHEISHEISHEECNFGMGDGKAPSRQGVIINEAAWMGTTNSANDEWIELKNISNHAVDIDGWQIIDKAEQIKIDLGLINKNKTKIEPAEFVLLERTNDESVPGIAADLIYAGNLKNTDEGLRLFDGQCNLIDEILAAPDWPAGNNVEKRTLERDVSGFGWHTSSIIGGTPKAENSQVTITYSGGGGGGASNNNQQQEQTTDNQQQAAKILISEIQITGGPGKTKDDFIELYNPNDFSVNLNGYRLVKRTKNGTSDTSIKSWTTDIFIPAKGYYLWANSGYTDISATPDATTTAIISDNNGVAIRFGAADTGVVIDGVAWGEAQNIFIEGSVFPSNPSAGQSIQRKFQNNVFVDTDNNANDFEIQNCPSPKAQSQICQTAESSNQSPTAFFVFSPQNPEVNQEIIFNAASSSDPDPNDEIVFYQWDFGDGATSTLSTATTTHIYSQAGDYLVSLIVSDNQNATSTTSSTIVIASPAAPVQSEVDHLVISEIYPDKSGDNFDFIELYNPTDDQIALNDYSLKIQKGEATSTTSLAGFSSNDIINAKSFFLIGLDEYQNSANATADIVRSSHFLPTTKTAAIFLFNNDDIVDQISYNPADFSIGQSLERKARQNNQCVSSQRDGEFLGNGCDTDSADDFEIRQTPNPQNSQSLPEPRSAPSAVQGFDIVYSSSTVSLNFSWQPSYDATGATSTIVYKIQEYNNGNPDAVIFNGSSTTAFHKEIDEVGRDYSFPIQAFDKDGLGSEAVSSTIFAPSFLENVYFYKDPQGDDYLVELRYEQYPFLPNIYPYGTDSWHSLILYFNQEPSGELILGNYGVPTETNGVLPVKYGTCGNSGSNAPHYNILLRDDIVSENNKCYPAGGIVAMTLNHGLLEDKNLILKAVNPNNIKDGDYLTVSYYGRISAAPSNNFKLIAVDKIKYYFQNEPPNHQPPTAPSDFQIDFDGVQTLTISFAPSVDPDSLDRLIQYQSSSDGENWEPLEFIGGSEPDRKYIRSYVNVGEDYHRYFRSVDEFGLTSEAVEVNWQYPPIIVQFSQNQNDSWSDVWGTKDWYWSCGQDPCPTKISLQSFVPENDFEFDSAAVKLKQKGNSMNGANMEMIVLNNKTENGEDKPDFNNVVAVSATKNVYDPDENREVIFSFNEPVYLENGVKYWFVLSVSSYSSGDSSFYSERNQWRNALASGDVYPAGQAAKATFGGGNFQVLPNSDWYLKLVLSQ